MCYINDDEYTCLFKNIQIIDKLYIDTKYMIMHIIQLLVLGRSHTNCLWLSSITIEYLATSKVRCKQSSFIKRSKTKANLYSYIRLGYKVTLYRMKMVFRRQQKYNIGNKTVLTCLVSLVL